MYCDHKECGHKARFVVTVEDRFQRMSLAAGYCSEHAYFIERIAASFRKGMTIPVMDEDLVEADF